MQKITLLFLSLFLLLAGCNQRVQEPVMPVPDLSLTAPIAPLDGRDPLTRNQINRLVTQYLLSDGQFRWDMVDDYVTWSAGMVSDSIYSIGYQPEGYQDIDKTIHEIDVKAPEWASVRQALIDFIVAEENLDRSGEPLRAEDILAFGDKPLPYFNIKITRYETVAQLRHMKVVRYAEPMGYGTEDDAPGRSESGCGGSPASSLPTSDYTTVSPGAKVSWNYYNLNIPGAWTYSQGDNIAVGVIDTGISPNQDKLNSNFASGWSTGRFRQRYGFFVTGWWWWASVDGPNDDCGHGTSMAGTIAAPRTSAGSTVGVAYKCDLVSTRATDDVVINESNEKDGVSDAYYYLGGRSDIRIISMSLGDVFYSSQVADAVRYANNRGKLIFCAAGTSLSWTSWWGVIFPANMSETVAVTGVKTGSNRQRCTVCHDGPEVDFVVTMEDASNSNRTPITLAMSGNTPQYTGGSSVATATTAGIAALVWARNPSMSRSTVLQKLKESADYYPSRNGSFGWGQIDALAAVQAAQ